MARAPRERRLENRTARAELKPRKEPYWSKISPGCLIGYYRARTTPTGTWFAKFRPIGAGPDVTFRAEKLGAADDVLDANGRDILSWVQANEKARPWFANMARLAAGGGEEPLTVGQAIEAYLADLKARGGVVREAERTMRKHVPDKLRRRRIMDLSANELSAWKLALVRDDEDPDEVRASRSTANRIMATLRAGLNLARDQRPLEITTDAAWKVGLKAFPSVTGSRNIILSNDETRRLIEAVHDQQFRDLVFALASCGARYGELASCHVQDAHLAVDGGARLHIPKGKTGPRTIAISAELRTLLARRVSGRAGTELLFTKGDGSSWGHADQIRPMRHAVKTAGLDSKVTTYSLRHSWIVAALLAGTEVRIVADHCGTSVKMVELTYSKFIGRHSGDLIRKSGPTLAKPQDNVIALPTGLDVKAKAG